MAQIHGWELVSEQYSENISIANGKLIHAYGTSKGVITLEEELVLQFETRVRSTNRPAAFPPYNDLVVYAPTRSGLQILKPRLTGYNYINGTSMPGNWYEKGPLQFGGLDDGFFGTEIWRCELVSSAISVKRLEWSGKMTPARFRAMQSL